MRNEDEKKTEMEIADNQRVNYKKLIFENVESKSSGNRNSRQISDKCFQLQIRRFFGFRFGPVEFDLPPFQLSVPEFSGAVVEGPHNDKDVSTFVLIFCTPFILHNILIHFLIYVTIQSN